MQKDIIKFNYNNGIVFKRKNSRLSIGTIPEHEDSYVIEFKLLSKDLSPRAINHVVKD